VHRGGLEELAHERFRASRDVALAATLRSRSAE
jgi:hypothetical protein